MDKWFLFYYILIFLKREQLSWLQEILTRDRLYRANAIEFESPVGYSCRARLFGGKSSALAFRIEKRERHPDRGCQLNDGTVLHRLTGQVASAALAILCFFSK